MKREMLQIELTSGVSVRATYVVFGNTSEAYPVGAVFANGWGCPAEVTELPAAALAEKGFKIVTFEPDTSAPITVSDRAQIMQTVAKEAFDNKPYVALGFSLGGDVACRCASDDQNAIGLIDCAGNHELSDRFLTGIVAKMDQEYFVVGDGLEEFLSEVSGSERQSVRDYAKHVQGMTESELRAYHFAARSSWEDGEAGGSLHTLTQYKGGPAFYVHGDGEMAEYLPQIQQSGVTELVIPDSGHFMYADQPEQYAETLAFALEAVNESWTTQQRALRGA